MKHFLTLRIPSSSDITLEATRVNLQGTGFVGITLPNMARHTSYFGRLVDVQLEPGQPTLSVTLEMSFEWPIPPYSAVHANLEVMVILQQQQAVRAVVRRRWEQPAQRNQWKLEPLDERQRRQLDYTRRLSEKEYRWLMLGQTPLSMDDKWFVFAEQNQVYYHRSWTGQGVFELDLKQDTDGFHILQAWSFVGMTVPFSERNVLQSLVDGICKEANEVYNM